MKLVVKIGGSVIASPINPELIQRYVELLKTLKNDGHEIVAVVGGGSLAREFIAIAKKLGLKESAQDEIAISVSRLFAQLFLKKLGKLSCQDVPASLEQIVQCLKSEKIVVLGGLKPGITTDTVATMIAEKIGADLIVKATDQEGIYNKDPRMHKDAIKLDHISLEDLTQIFKLDKHKAGIHQILDPEAVKILRQTRTKIVIVNGFNPKNVLLAVKGEKVGTLIT
jgi:uridylate kinase